MLDHAPDFASDATTAGAATPLLRWFRRRGGAAPRIVCFPHAGGTILSGVRLAQALPDRIDVAMVARPGHEPLEPAEPIRDLEGTAGRIADALAALAPEPRATTVLLGNSFGALLAFEVARALELRHGAARDGRDLHLVVSGFRSPSMPPSDVPLHRLPQVHLLAELTERFGHAGPGFEDGLTDAHDAALRADLEMCETYRLSAPTRLRCRVSVIRLLRDVSVSPDEIAAWRDVGASPVEIVPFDADHFPWTSAAPAFGALLTRLIDHRETAADASPQAPPVRLPAGAAPGS